MFPLMEESFADCNTFLWINAKWEGTRMKLEFILSWHLTNLLGCKNFGWEKKIKKMNIHFSMRMKKRKCRLITIFTRSHLYISINNHINNLLSNFYFTNNIINNCTQNVHL